MHTCPHHTPHPLSDAYSHSLTLRGVSVVVSSSHGGDYGSDCYSMDGGFYGNGGDFNRLDQSHTSFSQSDITHFYSNWHYQARRNCTHLFRVRSKATIYKSINPSIHPSIHPSYRYRLKNVNIHFETIHKHLLFNVLPLSSDPEDNLDWKPECET